MDSRVSVAREVTSYGAAIMVFDESSTSGATPGMRRKLAAILSADVVGYSRLMGEDEEATIHL